MDADDDHPVCSRNAGPFTGYRPMRNAAPSGPNAVSDYEAHCASVPPGGMASLQCLQQNMLEPVIGLPGAVRAVEAPATPNAESSPAAPAESAPAAAAPSLTPRPRLRQRPPNRLPRQRRRQEPGQKAQQRADRSDPQRVPVRLSAKLRRRADRRRCGAELSGKEQVQTFGQLSESRQCGRRRSGGCGGSALRLPGLLPTARRPPPWRCGRCGPARCFSS